MEPMPTMSRDEYLAVMRQKMEAMLGQVADAINNAPDGYIISASEEKVSDHQWSRFVAANSLVRSRRRRLHALGRLLR